MIRSCAFCVENQSVKPSYGKHFYMPAEVALTATCSCDEPGVLCRDKMCAYGVPTNGADRKRK